jgi:hypothetical protein
MIAPGTIKLSPACARAVIKELKKSAWLGYNYSEKIDC